jgi:hypothetical protein
MTVEAGSLEQIEAKEILYASCGLALERSQCIIFVRGDTP